MNSIIKLVHIKKPSEILEKAKKYPIGTVRKWTTGQFKKEAERKWKPVSEEMVSVISTIPVYSLAASKELGRKAFYAGINAPVHDAALMQIVDAQHYPLEGRDHMKAWMAGWTEENLKAPVPGQVESPKTKYGKKPLPAKGTPDWHKLKIAKDTMKMNPVMASVMGGPSVDEAKATLAEYGMVEAPGAKYGERALEKYRSLLYGVYEMNREGKQYSVAGGADSNLKTMQQLEGAGLVQLFEETDSRNREMGISHTVTLTDKGREALGLPEREPYPMIESPESAYGGIAEEILRQLGGNKFKMMTGAKMFVKQVTPQGEQISFRIPRAKDGINHVAITLNGKDLYDITFGRIHGVEYKVKTEFKDIYNDQLRDIFEGATGLYTSLGTMGRKSLSAHKLVFGKNIPEEKVRYRNV